VFIHGYHCSLLRTMRDNLSYGENKEKQVKLTRL